MKTFTHLRGIFRRNNRRTVALLAVLVAMTAVGFTFGKSNKVADAKFVAHEWGTFTSIQAGDGVLLNWQAVAPVELPAFVYNWARPGMNRVGSANFNKGSQMALQRMETPVVYFYGDQAQKIDLTVKFPKGKITEWYPQAKEVGPSMPLVASNAAPETFLAAYNQLDSTNRTRESLIRWNLEMLPASQTSSIRLPSESSGNHYFAARETDAAILRVNPTEAGQLSTEYEKFLFYRGVGNFGTPLKVTMSESGEITLANTGPDTLKDFFIFGIENGAGNFLHFSEIAPGQHKTLRLDLDHQKISSRELVTQISSTLAKALTQHGLYQRESDAMVKTWKDSWFQEDGLRVLYVLPRTWTDQTLPIDFKPAPRELVRVMVGRAEIITPALENKLTEQLTRAKTGDSVALSDAKILLQKCGRFALPLTNRVLSKLDPKREDKVLAALLAEPARAN